VFCKWPRQHRGTAGTALPRSGRPRKHGLQISVVGVVCNYSNTFSAMTGLAKVGVAIRGPLLELGIGGNTSMAGLTDCPHWPRAGLARALAARSRGAL
jgi:hypothetical protein